MTLRQTINKIGAAIVLLAVTVVVLNAVFGAAFGIVGGGDDADTVFEPAPDSFQFVSAGDSIGSGFDVTPSTGNAIGLYADGYVDIPPPNASTRADGWALAVTVEPMTIDENNSYTIYAEENATILVEYEAGNYSARYEGDTGNTGYVTAPASGDRQAVSVEYREDLAELRLYIDGELVDTSLLSSTIEPRQPAYQWDGTLDEFRRWDTAVGNSTHAAYAADPVQPLAPSNATHRLMFNSNDPVKVYYQDGRAERVGETDVVTGVQPPEMQRDVDYELRTDPIEIRVTSSGYLAGAPVVFVFGSGGTPFGALLQMVASTGGAALGLLVIGVLAAAAFAVLDEFNNGF